MAADASGITRLFEALDQAYGPQGWWPAESRFEMMLGAILVQNTSWRQAETALETLRAHGLLDPASLNIAAQHRVAQCIRSSGTFNQKTTYIRAFTNWYLRHGAYESLVQLETRQLREGLRSVKGIGDETADAILLYAFERPVFVIDSYTRRLGSRLGLRWDGLSYADLQLRFHQALPPDVPLFQQFHAVIVAHGKAHCQQQPLCTGCPISVSCHYESDQKQAS